MKTNAFEIARGAEAVLYKTNYLGKPSVLKQRVEKKYRVLELDQRIRLQRTKLECKLLNESKRAGVRTPLVYGVDKANACITMEFIRGKKLRDALNSKNIHYCEQLGEWIAVLHANGIIHGDLTTSNVIVNGKNAVLVDFGLGYFSNKLEDQTVDLLGLKKTYHSTHYSVPQGWKATLKGYSKYQNAQRVLAHVAEIEKRARYS